MTGAAVADFEGDLVDLLREVALLGIGRRIPVDRPLGGDEIGLDSLGFVSFLSAVEARFGVTVPDELWLERGRLALLDVAALVREAARSAAQPAPPAAPSPSLPRRIARRLYVRERCHVLTLFLGAEPLPPLRAPPGVRFRLATRDDVGLTQGGLWRRHVAKRNRSQFLRRLGAGHTCLVGIADGRVVAMTWRATTEERETMTGLTVRTPPGRYYAFDLNVHPEYGGRGLGEALLAFDARGAQQAGYEAAHTIIRADNLGMLSAIGALGFRPTGEIETHRILGRPLSRWRHGGRTGTRVLPL